MAGVQIQGTRRRTGRDTNKLIYFDHAATSWPKPPEVVRAMVDSLETAGGNPGRAGHRLSINAARVVYETREALATFFNIEDPGRILFTKNATEALNMAIFGLIKPGDHVITSSIEHNSVMRPLRYLEEKGSKLTVVSCSSEGFLDPGEVRRALRPETKMMVFTHASNVLGTLTPLEELARLARESGVVLLVDAAQTAGVYPIDVDKSGIDLLAFSGHKGLLGPTGTGGLILGSEIDLPPLLRGGTGSESELEIQPGFLPDKLESGTLNVTGLAGLGAGVRYLLEQGIGRIREHEKELVGAFIRGAEGISGVNMFGPRDPDKQVGVISLNIRGVLPSDVGAVLDREFAIMSRVGLHCAPSAHRTAGTFPGGTVRFGLGYSNTLAEVEYALEVLEAVAGGETLEKRCG